ncbi:MAG: multidrug effflux MFS transporter [Aquabacterium sp.]|uniref:multidrug effflux MFS transporter n=1 Tax=Aquabacterium sp. TaxID=1872578 RepID=UPI003BAF7EA6
MSASERAGAQPAMLPALPPHWVVVTALSLLLGLQPVATDLYLPALPQMPASLGVSAAAVQWTLSVLVLTFGIAQLFWGPVSDRLGRRPVLLAGLALFTLASVATVAAPDLNVLVLARALQGVGLAAALVCARAMIRDLYTPEQGAHVLSQGLSGLGVIALVGPIIGGITAASLGWRATLGLLGLFALASLIFIWRRLPETLPDHRRQQGQSLRQRLAQWQGIVRQPMFRAYTTLTSSTYGGLYVFLAASSFAFIEVLKVSRPVFGLVMASMSLFYLGGTLLCRRWLPLRGLTGTVRVGAGCSLTGGLWCAGLSAWTLATDHTPSPWAVMPGLWIYAIGHGLHQPCSQAGVVASFPHQAGAASALSGLIMCCVAFAISAVLAVWMKTPGMAGTLHPLTLGVGLGGALTAWVALGLVQRHGRPVAEQHAVS